MKLTMLVAIAMLATPLIHAQQTATEVSGTDQCGTDYISQANLGATYHCPTQNVNAWFTGQAFINEPELGGTINGFQSCQKEGFPPYKWQRRDEIWVVATCQCWAHWVVPNTLVVNPACTANINAVESLVFEQCSD